MKDTTVPGLSIETRRGFIVLSLPAQISWQNYAGIREGVSRTDSNRRCNSAVTTCS